MIKEIMTDRLTPEEQARRIRLYEAVQKEFLGVINEAKVTESSDAQLLQAMKIMLGERGSEISFRFDRTTLVKVIDQITFGPEVVGIVFEAYFSIQDPDELPPLANPVYSCAFSRDPISAVIKPQFRFASTVFSTTFDEAGRLVMKYYDGKVPNSGFHDCDVTLRKIRIIRSANVTS